MMLCHYLRKVFCGTLRNVRSHDELSRIIQGELERAMAQFRQTSVAFREVMAAVPSSIPSPDGSLRIHQISAEHRKAIAELRNALERQNKFFIYRIVPDDLRGD